MTTNSSAAGNLYQARTGPNFQNTKTPEKHKTSQCPDIFKLFWKEEEIIHHDVTPNMPPIMRPVAGIKFEMSSFCA